MGSPKEVWSTGPAGSLCSEAHGFDLSIRRSTASGRVQFMVLGRSGSVAEPPPILASGNERSALGAMLAAEQAASAIGQWSAEMWAIGIGATGECTLWPPWRVQALHSFGAHRAIIQATAQ